MLFISSGYCQEAKYLRGQVEAKRIAIETRSTAQRASRSRPYVKLLFKQDAEVANKIYKLNIKYPNAYKNLDRIEEFSHFGSILKQVEVGEYDIEKFLEEYELYLKYNN